MITDPRALRILDVLFVIALLPQPLVPLTFLAPADQWRAVVYTALLGAEVAWWIVWRRRPSAGWTPLAMVAAALACTAVGDGPIPLLLVAFSLVILVVVRGPAAGVAVTAALVGLAVLMMTVVYHQEPGFIALQVAAALAALGVVWLVATLLRLFVVASDEARAAHAALEASLETEKELLLARERAREAGELHDGLGHRLTAIGLLLSAAERIAASDPGRAWETVGEARAAASEALQEMRVWVRALHPVGIEALGDASAFQAIADRFRDTGLDVEVETAISSLGGEQALLVRRCLQEGLTNVVRHARASRVRLSVSQDEARLRVAIEDDGTGLADARPGFGLAELRRRVEDLGGTLDAGRSTLGGSRLLVELPA